MTQEQVEFESTGDERLDEQLKYNLEEESLQAESESEEEEQEIFSEDESEEILQDIFSDEPSTVDRIRDIYGSPGINTSARQGFTEEIIAKESGGNYQAVNPHSSAAGKYQFLWDLWGPEIAQFTGIRSKQEFLNNPQAQDSFYENYYLPNKLMPAVRRLKKRGIRQNINTLAKLIHFRGEQGAMDYLSGKASNQPEWFNTPTSDYISQTGGLNYAQTAGYNPTLSLKNKIPYSYGESSVVHSGINDYYSEHSGLNNVPTSGKGDIIETVVPEAAAFEKIQKTVDERITSGLDVVQKGIDFTRDISSLAGSAISGATSGVSALLSRKQERDRQSLLLKDLQTESTEDYINLSNFQNKTKSTWT